MFDIEIGQYMIFKGNDDHALRLTLELGEDEYLITLKPPMKGQNWAVIKHPNGNYILENSDYDGAQFLAPVDLRENANLSARSTPFQWRLQQTSVPNKFHIVVPDGPIDGNELAVDMAAPPKVALHPLDVDNSDQAWAFIKIGNL